MDRKEALVDVANEQVANVRGLDSLFSHELPRVDEDYVVMNYSVCRSDRPCDR